MEVMIYVICVITVLQLIVISLIVYQFRKLKFLMELESECIRFDVLSLKLAVLSNSSIKTKSLVD